MLSRSAFAQAPNGSAEGVPVSPSCHFHVAFRPGTSPVGNNRSTRGVSSVVGDGTGEVVVADGSGAAEVVVDVGESPVSGVPGESSVLAQPAVRVRPASRAAANSREEWRTCMPSP